MRVLGFSCFFLKHRLTVGVKDGGGEAEVSQCTLGWGSRGGTQGAFPHPSWTGKGEEAFHMPAGVTYVTEEHLFFVKWTLTYLAPGILGDGGWQGSTGGMFRARERLRVGV